MQSQEQRGQEGEGPVIRLVREAAHGLFGGGYAGAVIGAAEAVSLLGDPQVQVGVDILFFGALVYAAVGAVIGLAAGAFTALLELPLVKEPGAGVAASLVAASGGLLFLMFRPLPRGNFPPPPELVQDVICVGLAGLLAVAALFAVCNAFIGKRVWATALGLVTVLALNGGLTVASKFFQPPPEDAAGRKPLALRSGVPEGLEKKPNTLFIVVDSLRVDYVPAYQKEPAKLDGMRRLQRDGVVFTQAYAASSATVPAMTSLFTARPLSRHGVRRAGDKLDKDIRTLFEVQRDAKVATGAVLNHPAMSAARGFSQGFDHFVLDAGLSRAPRLRDSELEKLRLVDFLQKLLRFLKGDAGRPPAPDAAPAGEPVPGIDYRPAREVFAEAQRFLGAAKDARWSLVLHLMEPHAPYQTHGLPPLEQLSREGRYASEVAYVDDALSDFLAYLDEHKLYDNTLIVFTADHGEELGDHGAYGHGDTLYDEVIRVPLIVKFPKSENKGKRWGGQVRSFDAFTTAVVAQGLAPPSGVEWRADGRRWTLDDDLTSSRRKEREKECDARSLAADRPVLSEVHVGKATIVGLRQHGYQLIRASKGNPRKLPASAFYDLLDDKAGPIETDVRTGTCRPVRKVAGAMADALDAGVAPPDSDDGEEDDAGVSRWLKNLLSGDKEAREKRREARKARKAARQDGDG